MCLAYLMYYPRVDLSACYSRPDIIGLMSAAGIEEIYDQERIIRCGNLLLNYLLYAINLPHIIIAVVYIFIYLYVYIFPVPRIVDTALNI